MPLTIHSFTFNPLQENTYLIEDTDTKTGVLIDLGASNAHERQILSDFVKAQDIIIQAIWLTHSHIDHVLGLAHFADMLGIPYYQSEQDVANLKACPAYAPSFGIFNFGMPQAEAHIIAPEAMMQLGAHNIQTLLTPGHCQGHLSYYHPDIGCISGDALFAGSIGRTDLPGGNYAQLISSIRSQLLTLPDETPVYPGHGPATTIGEERRTNPFLTRG